MRKFKPVTAETVGSTSISLKKKKGQKFPKLYTALLFVNGCKYKTCPLRRKQLWLVVTPTGESVEL